MPWGVGSQEEHFKSEEAAGRRQGPRALLLTFPIPLVLHRGIWWHQPPPAPLRTTGTPHAGEGEGSGMGSGQQLHQHPSIPPGLSLHPQLPQGKGLSQKWACGHSNPQEGTVSRHQTKPTAGGNQPSSFSHHMAAVYVPMEIQVHVCT